MNRFTLIPLQRLFFQVKSLLGLEIFVNAVIGTLTRNVIFVAMVSGDQTVKPVLAGLLKINALEKGCAMQALKEMATVYAQ